MTLLRANAEAYNGITNPIADAARIIEQKALLLIDSSIYKDQIATAMVKIDFMWWSNKFK